MGKKKGAKGDKPSKKDKGGHRCGACKNFDADKKGGWCRYRDKKRSASDKTCGNFNPR